MQANTNLSILKGMEQRNPLVLGIAMKMNGGGITHLNTNAYRQTTHKKTPTDFKNQPNHQKTKQQKSMTLAEYVMSTSIMDVASI